MAGIVDFPDGIVPNSISGLVLRANNLIYTSPYNNSVDTHGLMGDRWMMTLVFDTIDDMNGVDEIARLQSFIWSLGGVRGRFMMRMFGRRGRPSRGQPKVSGQNQMGELLTTDGWQPNVKVLTMGDYIQVGNELKFVKEDCWSSSVGTANVRFCPPLRKAPDDNTVIITENPRGLFRVADDDQGKFDLTAGLNGSVSIDIVEAFDVL